MQEIKFAKAPVDGVSKAHLQLMGFAKSLDIIARVIEEEQVQTTHLQEGLVYLSV